MGDRDSYYLGIDVGSTSARAGIFSASGEMRAYAVRGISVFRPAPDFVEQSSENIWESCCHVVKDAVSKSGLPPKQIRGIGFDATCSLVVLDGADRPVRVSRTGADEQNIIVWMDHRAVEQADRINATGHPVLRYVGGKISPEMQSPKLLWLKENLPETWARSTRFFDLPDFLVYRSTDVDVRSLCSTGCKWTYQGHEAVDAAGNSEGWVDSYWRGIGLGDLVDEGYSRIGQNIRPIGEPVGGGLSERAADELGLVPGTAVGVSIIDAHAGGLGLLGAPVDGVRPTLELMEKRLALIGGTSTCHMAVSRSPLFISGIWGPYFSAMVPEMWLTEGGQSATGALIDHIIQSHIRYPELQAISEKSGDSIYGTLNKRLDRLSENAGFQGLLTLHLHVLPYFHGNRSPRAEPRLRGMVSGIRLSDSLDDLALQYLATIQAIAYGTRHIIETMNAAGYRIDTIYACGGGTKNRVFLREHADITGCRMVLPRESEAVLLGASVLGAVASGGYRSVLEAMSEMSAIGSIIEPDVERTAVYHQAKYTVFLRMYEDQMAYRQMMKQF